MMPAVDDGRSTTHTRVAVVERLEGRVLRAAGVAPAGFLPSPAPDRYQLSTRGAISPGGDVDFFSLGRLRAGDALTLGLSGAGSARGSLWDGVIELLRAGFDPANPLSVAINNDGGSGRDSLLRQELTMDDVYYARAKSSYAGAGGTYDLAAWLETDPATPPSRFNGAPSESEPNDTGPSAEDLSSAWRAVKFESSRAGEVEVAGTADEYVYQWRAGDLVTIGVASTSDLDASLSLLHDSGDKVLATDDGYTTRAPGNARDAHVLGYVVPRDGPYRVRVAGNDRTRGAYRVNVYLSREETAVIARHLFYNNSFFDGRSGAADPGDDGAIATDKAALLPGRAATLANVSNYSRGINGVMLDVTGVRVDPAADDFRFEVTAPNTSDGWAVAPAPASISRRPGAGAFGSDRVTIIWPDGAIIDRWLRVTWPAAATGLAADEVFAFGSLAGETGDEAGAARVGPADVMRARFHSRPSAPAPPTSWFDFNRDGRINAIDAAVARARASRSLSMSFPTTLSPGPAPAVLSILPAIRCGPAARRAGYDPASDLLS